MTLLSCFAISSSVRVAKPLGRRESRWSRGPGPDQQIPIPWYFSVSVVLIILLWVFKHEHFSNYFLIVWIIFFRTFKINFNVRFTVLRLIRRCFLSLILKSKMSRLLHPAFNDDPYLKKHFASGLQYHKINHDSTLAALGCIFTEYLYWAQIGEN